MKVRATRLGIWKGTRVRAGEVFEIPDEPKDKKTGKPVAFSKLGWMEEVKEAKSAPAPAPEVTVLKAPVPASTPAPVPVPVPEAPAPTPDNSRNVI